MIVRTTHIMGILAGTALLASCASQDDASSTGADQGTGTMPDYAAYFDEASLVEEPKIVDCTLSSGTVTRCLSVTIGPKPASFEIGPWCPRNVSDGPDVSGIWLDNGKVYDADGAFIQNLSKFYDDDEFQLFDPVTGKINVTDTEASCRAAARPDVDPEFQNHCVECQVEYLEEGTTQTYVIPLNPVEADSVGDRVGHDGVGIAFSGARLDASAPVDAILGAHTLAPFDDCGGHVNPNVGYHIHAVTEGCLSEVSINDVLPAQIGVAMDGYPILARLGLDGSEPEGLDSCGGQYSDDIGYHYRAGAAGSNQILGCHKGETGCVLTSPDDSCDASQEVRRGPPGGGPPGGGPPDGAPPGDRPPPPGE